MKKSAIAIFAFVFYFACVNAQTSIQIKDIYVSPVMVIDTITNLPVESDGETLAVLCKVNDLSSVESVIILFGTDENVGDVVSVNGVISVSDETYYLTIGSEIQELEDNIISATIVLTQQQSDAYNFITMYAIDDAEQESNHLVFTK